LSFTRFVIKNSFRNKRRTALTVLSIGFSLFLLILLQTILSVFTNPPASEQSGFRLVVRRSTSFVDQMPLSYWPQLQKVPHVTQVVPMALFFGYYQDPKQLFPSLATDQNRVWDMFPEQHVSPGGAEALKNERTGAIVGEQLMKRFAWHVGQHVTLVGQQQAINLEFKIVGTYESEISGQDNVFYFRGDYLNEALDNPNTVGFFWVRADSGPSVPGIIEAIDTMFHNSPAETKTETEKSFVLGFVGMMGNIRVFIGSIAIVVLFTMLLVAASTMAMTVRERVREVAILKSIGYPRGTVLGLILGEAVFIAFLGGVVGCLFTILLGFGNLPKWTGGFVPVLPIAPQTLALAILTGAGIGLVSAFYPAFQASQMTITEALRRLD